MLIIAVSFFIHDFNNLFIIVVNDINRIFHFYINDSNVSKSLRLSNRDVIIIKLEGSKKN